MHAEFKRSRHDRLCRGHFFFQLGPPRIRVLGSFDVATEGQGDATFDGQRAAHGGRPCDDRRSGPQVETLSDAVGSAQYAGEPRHTSLKNREHRIHARSNRPGVLCLGPDRKAGLVDKRHDRNMKEVAEFDEASNFRCAVRGHRPAVVVTVVGKNADAMPVHAGEARHLAAAPECAYLKETALVDDVLNQLPNLVGAASLARDDLKELLFSPVPLIASIWCWFFSSENRSLKSTVLGSFAMVAVKITLPVAVVK